MKERRYVKFRVDMYEDTKFKIIDRMSKRDLIHYVWNRIVVLAGKVNQEGDLYMSRNIPYTVETLSIEFNRDSDEIKDALDVLMNLEMIEIVDNNIYKVKNFVKHQNIKVKEKNEILKEENEIKVPEKADMEKNKNVEVSTKNVIPIKEKEKEEVGIKENKDDQIALLKADNTKSDRENERDNNSNVIEVRKEQSNQHNNSPVIFEVEKNTSKKKRKVNKKKNESDIEVYDEDISDDIADKSNKDDLLCWISEGEIVLGEGERKIAEWSFD